MDLNLDELVNELYNQKSGVEFSWNMTFRAFIQWVLDIEIGYIALFIAIIFLISVIYNIWIKK